MAMTPLTGSNKKALPGAISLGKADPAERLEVSLVLRRRDHAGFNDRMAQLAAGKRDTVGHLSREEFRGKFGADDADLAAIRQFAASQGLSVADEHAGRRIVVLSGTVAQFNAAFGVDLEMYEHDAGTYRGRVGDIMIPDALTGVVQAVLGLDDRPAAQPHFRRHDGSGSGAKAAPASFNPNTLAQLYNFPAGNGAGECVAIIELGGGYVPKDLKTYFTGLGVTNPKVKAVSVDHAKNKPTKSADGPDGEVMLDIEVVGAVAPGASIAVYFAPNTDAGFLDAITTALHDTANKPSVISISWGGPESSWTQQSLTAFDQAFQDAATLGVTVTVASGDNGSSDGVTTGGDHVDFPASSPHVLACGGTSLQASSGTITSESVWNDGAQGGAGGGGVSASFALPSWQEGLSATKNGAASALAMRGVPDVSGDADPETGYNVRVDGKNTVIGGTSAVAPLWAGLIARINAARGSAVGFVNPALYHNSAALNDITQGNNGDFSATKGWDACTGLGSPNGTKVAAALGTAPAT